jgi:basic membrane protein A
MRRTIQWGFAAILIFGTVFFTSCTKSGDIIYQTDPADLASNAPLVTVIYDPNALGDRGYNDLIYQGVEQAAQKHGLRTMQLSPASVDEGLTYLRMMLQTMTNPADTVHRLLIVAAASYDDYLRQNNSRLDANPNADLLYLETETPFEGKGSTFYMPYYGAMYEAGAITPAQTTDVLLVGANPLVKPVTDAMQAYTDGFQASPIATDDQTEKNLVTVWLSEEVSGGFSVADTTVIQILTSQEWQTDSPLLVPICGGSATNFRRLIEMFNLYDFVGIDCEAVSAHCNFSVVKHIDRAVQKCIEQWLSPDGMPKHQLFGLASGYTGIVIHPYTDDSKSRFAALLSPELQQSIHQEAIRKEAEYEK